MKSDIDFVTAREIAFRARDTGTLGEAHAQGTPWGDSTDLFKVTGEAHDPDDRKGGSRVRSVRLFLKESHAAVGADMAGRGRA